jgi:hypothetical protein
MPPCQAVSALVRSQTILNFMLDRSSIMGGNSGKFGTVTISERTAESRTDCEKTTSRKDEGERPDEQHTECSIQHTGALSRTIAECGMPDNSGRQSCFGKAEIFLTSCAALLCWIMDLIRDRLRLKNTTTARPDARRYA